MNSLFTFQNLQDVLKRYKIFHRRVIIPTVLIPLVIILCYVIIEVPNIEEEHVVPRSELNLTQHSLWDAPVLEDNQTDSLWNIIQRGKDSTYLKELTRFDNVLSDAEKIKIGKNIDNMPDSQYKGYLQLRYLYNYLMSQSAKDITVEKIQNLLQKGIKLSQGKYVLPQGFFFLYWSNCLSMIANRDRSDLVTAECVRMMKLCRQHNQPLGLMYSYYVLATGLITNKDYRSASDNLDKAVAVAEKYYPRFWGKEWNKSMDLSGSYTYILYTYLKAVNTTAHWAAKDTLWLKNHEAEMLRSLDKVEDFSTIVYLYYALANYYIDTGQEAKYSYIIRRLEKDMKECGVLNEGEVNSDVAWTYYGQALMNHEIHAGHASAALKLAEEYKDKIRIGKECSLIYDAYMLAGRYKEAAEGYKHIMTGMSRQMNGRNSNIFQTMYASIDNENKEMQILEAKLENQHQRLIYVTLLIAVAIVMIIGLAYFLIRQRKMNKELNIAMKREERANHVKDIFLKNISHEFRTPLNAVSGFAQIMTDPSLPLDEESARMMAGGIKEGADQLISLLDNIVKVTDKLSTLDKLEDAQTILQEIEKENQQYE